MGKRRAVKGAEMKDRYEIANEILAVVIVILGLMILMRW